MANASPELAKALRAFALTLPESREDYPWDHAASKVRKKAFVFWGMDDDPGLSVGVKLKFSMVDVLQEPFAKPMGYGLGRHGWVSLYWEAGAEVDQDQVEAWIIESFRAVAPKTVARKLDP